MNNVMLDLETWGTRPGSAIRSIGAVAFDPFSSDIGDEFYCNISDRSCEAADLVQDKKTVEWWSKQSQQAQDALTLDPLTLTEVGVLFESFWRKAKGIFVWSQGANFDEPLWSAAMHAVGRGVPWRFYDSRDTRTAYDLAQFDARTVKRYGTYHNALDDAKHQARCVQMAYSRIKVKKA